MESYKELMRIISGTFKGKSISFLKSKTTRPLKDSVRENIFNIINHSNLLNIKLINTNVLDLYSGTGAFGIECISRGAKKSTFVEKNSNAIEILKKNLFELSIEKKSLVIQDEIKKFLNKKKLEKFDVMFLDPPFAENRYIEVLELIKKNKIYSQDYIIIIHRENKTVDNFNGIFKPLLIKKYGRSKIIFGRF
tara:strand:+ start:784 stop:1362 length:579 start_codon:yes stop_codon:yes gene_type:complete